MYKPYRCGKDCKGGYNCLVCLFVFNLKRIAKKFKKIIVREGASKKTSPTINSPINRKD